MRPCKIWASCGSRCVEKILALNQNIFLPQNQNKKYLHIFIFKASALWADAF